MSVFGAHSDGVLITFGPKRSRQENAQPGDECAGCPDALAGPSTADDRTLREDALRQRLLELVEKSIKKTNSPLKAKNRFLMSARGLADNLSDWWGRLSRIPLDRHSLNGRVYDQWVKPYMEAHSKVKVSESKAHQLFVSATTKACEDVLKTKNLQEMFVDRELMACTSAVQEEFEKSIRQDIRDKKIRYQGDESLFYVPSFSLYYSIRHLVGDLKSATDEEVEDLLDSYYEDDANLGERWPGKNSYLTSLWLLHLEREYPDLVCYSSYIENFNPLTYDYETKTLDMRNFGTACGTTGERFVIGKFKFNSHLNALIWDRTCNVLVRFEPHGSHHEIRDNRIEQLMIDYCKNTLNGARYIGPSEYQSPRGPQANEKLCAVWSMIFIHYVLEHSKQNVCHTPEFYKTIIERYLNPSNPHALSVKARKYAATIMRSFTDLWYARGNQRAQTVDNQAVARRRLADEIKNVRTLKEARPPAQTTPAETPDIHEVVPAIATPSPPSPVVLPRSQLELLQLASTKYRVSKTFAEAEANVAHYTLLLSSLETAAQMSPEEPTVLRAVSAVRNDLRKANLAYESFQKPAPATPPQVQSSTSAPPSHVLPSQALLDLLTEASRKYIVPKTFAEADANVAKYNQLLSSLETAAQMSPEAPTVLRAIPPVRNDLRKANLAREEFQKRAPATQPQVQSSIPAPPSAVLPAQALLDLLTKAFTKYIVPKTFAEAGANVAKYNQLLSSLETAAQMSPEEPKVPRAISAVRYDLNKANLAYESFQKN
jgi:hypothetical protein